MITGTKSAGTWLYVNDVRQEEIPLGATEWRYVIDYPIAGVNAVKIRTEDEDGNRSETVVVSHTFLQGNMEEIKFDKGDLLKKEKFSEATSENLELREEHGTDPQTGESIVVEGYLKVKR